MLFSDWWAAERRIGLAQARRKTPATIEELRFTYPNIRDSQHALTRRQGLKIAGRFHQPNAG
jgi:hypothetical protein